MKFAKGSLRNIYAIRFEPGEDVLLGLQKFCEDHGVGHGAILSGIGSLNGSYKTSCFNHSQCFL